MMEYERRECSIEIIALDEEGNGLGIDGQTIIVVPKAIIGNKVRVRITGKHLLGYQAELLDEDEEDDE